MDPEGFLMFLGGFFGQQGWCSYCSPGWPVSHKNDSDCGHDYPRVLFPWSPECCLSYWEALGDTAGGQTEHKWRKFEADATKHRWECTFVQWQQQSKLTSTTASAQGHPGEVFWIVRGLLSQAPDDVDPKNIPACCDSFAVHFADKIACIHHSLRHHSWTGSNLKILLECSLVLDMDDFQLMRLGEEEKVPQSVQRRRCLKGSDLLCPVLTSAPHG